MIEVWKRVVGFPNYQVSNLGNIIGPRGPMKPILQDSGYYHVGLINNGRQSFRILSRLVCEAFHGSPPFDNAKALHKDDNKDNNTENNLYWGTHQQNMDDGKRNKRFDPLKARTCKINWEIVREIRRVVKDQNLPYPKAAQMFGISKATICSIINNKSWRE